MADRKVLVKYYPPDFDFDKLQAKKKVLRIQQQQLKRRRGDVFDPPQKRHKNKIMNVRMMFPFTLKCGTCSEFIYVGTKFNSRVEKVEVSSVCPGWSGVTSPELLRDLRLSRST